MNVATLSLYREKCRCCVEFSWCQDLTTERKMTLERAGTEMTSWSGSEQSSATSWPEDARLRSRLQAPPVCWPGLGSSLLSGVAKRPGLAVLSWLLCLTCDVSLHPCSCPHLRLRSQLSSDQAGGSGLPTSEMVGFHIWHLVKRATVNKNPWYSFKMVHENLRSLLMIWQFCSDDPCLLLLWSDACSRSWWLVLAPHWSAPVPTIRHALSLVGAGLRGLHWLSGPGHRSLLELHFCSSHPGPQGGCGNEKQESN